MKTSIFLIVFLFYIKVFAQNQCEALPHIGSPRFYISYNGNNQVNVKADVDVPPLSDLAWILDKNYDFTNQSLYQNGMTDVRNDFDTYWDGQSGVCDCTGRRLSNDNELAYYSDNNVILRQDNGTRVLSLVYNKTPTPCGTACSSSSNTVPKQYSTGVITSKSDFHNFGKFEICCKLPKGKFFPAFWLYGFQTEIDIFEFFSESIPNNPSINLIDWSSNSGKYKTDTLGYNIRNVNQQSQCFNSTIDYSASYHTFTCIWGKYFMDFYVDGVKTYRATRLRTSSATSSLNDKNFNDPNNPQSSFPLTSQYLDNPAYPRDNDPLKIIVNLASDVSNQQSIDGSLNGGNLYLDIKYIRYYKLPLWISGNTDKTNYFQNSEETYLSYDSPNLCVSNTKKFNLIDFGYHPLSTNLTWSTSPDLNVVSGGGINDRSLSIMPNPPTSGQNSYVKVNFTDGVGQNTTYTAYLKNLGTYTGGTVNSNSLRYGSVSTSPGYNVVNSSNVTVNMSPYDAYFPNINNYSSFNFQYVSGYNAYLQNNGRNSNFNLPSGQSITLKITGITGFPCPPDIYATFFNAPMRFAASPNPASSTLKLSVSKSKEAEADDKYELPVFDKVSFQNINTGALAMEKQADFKNNEMNFDITTLPKGNYSIIIKSKKGDLFNTSFVKL